MDFVKRAWEDGWLDEFADNHFLIMAIEDNLNHFDWEHQFIYNGLFHSLEFGWNNQFSRICI